MEFGLQNRTPNFPNIAKKNRTPNYEHSSFQHYFNFSANTAISACAYLGSNYKCYEIVMHERHFYRSSSGPVFFLSVLVRSDLFFIGPVRSSVFLSSVFLTVCRLHYVSVFILSLCKFVPFPNFSK